MGSFSGEKLIIAQKNESRKVVQGMLISLSHYLNYNFAGNKPVLLSSRYTVSEGSRKRTSLGIPKNFSVMPGVNAGSMILKVKSVANAQNYIFMFRETGSLKDEWQIKISSSPSRVISGLPQMIALDFKIAVAGNKDQVEFTNIISSYVS